MVQDKVREPEGGQSTKGRVLCPHAQPLGRESRAEGGLGLWLREAQLLRVLGMRVRKVAGGLTAGVPTGARGGGRQPTLGLRSPILGCAGSRTPTS